MTVTTLTKPKRERNEQYLAWIRTQLCILWGRATEVSNSRGETGLIPHICAGPTDAHHIRLNGHGGIGTKPNDKRCVPVCRRAHEEYHRLSRGLFEREYGLDLEAEILRLNGLYRPPKVRKQRERKPTARIKIDHCACGRSHTLPLSKIAMSRNAVAFKCPLKNISVETKR